MVDGFGEEEICADECDASQSGLEIEDHTPGLERHDDAADERAKCRPDQSA